MRLFCQKALLLVLASTVACHDSSTAPVPVPSYFVLKAINGRQLPTYFVSQSNITILSASLGLDGAGKAKMSEIRREIVQGIPSETLYTSTYDYRINGDQIEIGTFGPCNDVMICAGNLIGTITNGVLSLTIMPYSTDGSIVYEYHRMGLD
jgi:hypothetical protein